MELQRKSYHLPPLFKKEFEEVYKLKHDLNKINTNFYEVYNQNQQYQRFF